MAVQNLLFAARKIIIHKPLYEDIKRAYRASEVIGTCTYSWSGFGPLQVVQVVACQMKAEELINHPTAFK